MRELVCFIMLILFLICFILYVFDFVLLPHMFLSLCLSSCNRFPMQFYRKWLINWLWFWTYRPPSDCPTKPKRCKHKDVAGAKILRLRATCSRISGISWGLSPSFLKPSDVWVKLSLLRMSALRFQDGEACSCLPSCKLYHFAIMAWTFVLLPWLRRTTGASCFSLLSRTLMLVCPITLESLKIWRSCINASNSYIFKETLSIQVLTACGKVATTCLSVLKPCAAQTGATAS